ncbi:Aste57867_12193 [Aphanomyces stellatus]|uniref:Aste57867_12193 protein n=1 Tax=Aphanomyces stellatus TaxID=120398 RepID=A0A485KVC8_9STRA|nr:hypothetical protein As57867_012148 [Aphanomyces stellatus]VFT89047.1 Aste57867_12193 [Aphanomyces stellatus]
MTKQDSIVPPHPCAEDTEDGRIVVMVDEDDVLDLTVDALEDVEDQDGVNEDLDDVEAWFHHGEGHQAAREESGRGYPGWSHEAWAKQLEKGHHGGSRHKGSHEDPEEGRDHEHGHAHEEGRGQWREHRGEEGREHQHEHAHEEGRGSWREHHGEGGRGEERHEKWREHHGEEGRGHQHKHEQGRGSWREHHGEEGREEGHERAHEQGRGSEHHGDESHEGKGRGEAREHGEEGHDGDRREWHKHSDRGDNATKWAKNATNATHHIHFPGHGDGQRIKQNATHSGNWTNSSIHFPTHGAGDAFSMSLDAINQHKNDVGYVAGGVAAAALVCLAVFKLVQKTRARSKYQSIRSTLEETNHLV